MKVRKHHHGPVSPDRDESPRADLDLGFLARDDLRPVRLLLDYLKPELSLVDHGVEATVVVFGSTRILPEAMARTRLEAAEEDAARGAPGADAAMRVARHLLALSPYYEVAREFGARVSRRHDVVVMTGGGPGLMEAANRGATEAGANTVGLNISLPTGQPLNPWVTPELGFEFRYFALRKLHFVQRARALVAFPGGYGTLDELFEVLTLVQTGKRQPLPIVLVGRDFWESVIDLDHLLEWGMISASDRELIRYAETADQICDVIGPSLEKGAA